MKTWWLMNGYGVYVWPAYGITFILLMGLWLKSRIAYKNIKIKTKRRLKDYVSEAK